MTRAVRDRILKDANGDISDHLRNHIHLTNCIHLKNHMHKHSPILSDRSVMKDLIALQRSRSLRDPSTSPPSWRSPSVIDLLSKRIDNNAVVLEGRRSVGSERRRDSRRLSGCSPLVASQASSKVAPAEETQCVNGGHDRRKSAREESSQKILKTGLMVNNHEELQQDQEGNELGHDIVIDDFEANGRKTKHKGKHNNQDVHIKTLSEQLNEVTLDSDGVACSHFKFRGAPERKQGEQEARVGGFCSGMNRGKRRKFCTTRRNRATCTSKNSGAQNDVSVASNSFDHQGLGHSKFHLRYKVEEEYNEQNFTRDPNNGCGIPWNWSRIHDRGKSFLDIAGRSLSCGLSDPRLRKGGAVSQVRDVSDKPVASDASSSPIKSDVEARPLLFEGSGSQGSTENTGWVHDYSGELGIFADNLLKRDIDSDAISEARFHDQREARGSRHHRHQNMTQKYMPKTFTSLVGQNLVSQALSNAVLKRKVGLLYVFYGPHGTGKTSCARIFSRALNCQSLEHPKPCNICRSCTAHDMGKNRNIREMGPVTNFDCDSILDLLDDMIVSQNSTSYKVLIFDDCDTMSPDCWNAISKILDRAPRRMVCVLVSSSLDVLPHIIISRCQKFFFPKLKDADIIYTLQWIAAKEDLEIDRDALKLIASCSDGSLRDAEMTLEQLSLLGQRISVSLVQELVGLISDEKLVDLLDLALSADTVNTVKNLREIMEAGVEPLALMSQLATVITDILAGSYDFTKERSKRKFFRQQPVSKENMEKLRQALKTLSEAQKQLRMSNDKLTWLTAALLQLAPDQQYILPGSSAETSMHHSPLIPNNGVPRITRRAIVEQTGPSSSVNDHSSKHRKRHVEVGIVPQQLSPTYSADVNRKELEEIWLEVIKKIQINSIREFIYQEGKLTSVSFGAVPTFQLMFSSQLTKCKAQKFSAHILQAFESVLGSTVSIEIRSDPREDLRSGAHVPLILPSSKEGILINSPEVRRSEIIELAASPRETSQHVDANRKFENTSLQKIPSMDSTMMRRKIGEQNLSQSIVRSKVSLAHVLQQAEGCKQSGWSQRKAVSIAEKLEQENLRLESRSRSLLCWKAPRVTRQKLSRFKIKTRRRSHSLLKLVPCGKCLSVKSPR